VFIGKWMRLEETIMLNKISNSHKDKYHMFFLIYGIWKGKQKQKQVMNIGEVLQKGGREKEGRKRKK
jgi:hypothetical protein